MTDESREAEIRNRPLLLNGTWEHRDDVVFLLHTIDDLRARLAAVEQERDDLQRTFDLMWDADQRAIKRWQETGEGREFTWPDRSKLTEWLLCQRDAALAEAKALRERLEFAISWIQGLPHYCSDEDKRVVLIALDAKENP